MASVHMQGYTFIKLVVNGFEQAGKRFFSKKVRRLVISVQTCQAKYQIPKMEIPKTER